MLSVRTTTQFRKDVNRIKKQGKDIRILQNVMNLIAQKIPLPPQYCDHVLRGNYNRKFFEIKKAAYFKVSCP